MPRWIIVLVLLFIGAILALAGFTLVDTLFTTTHMTPEPRSPAAPAAPPPALPKTEPAPAPSVSNTEVEKKLDAALARIAELEKSKLKAGSVTKPEPETKSSSLSDWVPSWWHTKLSSPPSVTPAPTATVPAPKIAAPPAAERPKSKLDETLTEIEKKLKGTGSTPAPAAPPPTIAPPPKVEAAPADKAEAKWYTLPKLPSPPAMLAAIKGPSGGWGGFFSGGCSVREKTLKLEVGAEPVQLTNGECRVIYYVSPSAIVVARDGIGEYFLKPGAGSGRNPEEIKLLAGNGHFKYSLCPKSSPEGLLNWDCTPLR